MVLEAQGLPLPIRPRGRRFTASSWPLKPRPALALSARAMLGQVVVRLAVLRVEEGGPGIPSWAPPWGAGRLTLKQNLMKISCFQLECVFTWSLEAAEGDCDPRHTLDFRLSVLGTHKGPPSCPMGEGPGSPHGEGREGRREVGERGGKTEWRGLISPGLLLPSWKRWGWENIWPEHLVRT